MNVQHLSVKVEIKSFDELSVRELYDLLQLRSEIFVLEQKCLYQDMDGLDPLAQHCLIYNKQGKLLAYSRIFPAGISFEEASIGRILSKEHGTGLGKRVLEESIATVIRLYGQVPIRIGAQCYAVAFYHKFGFQESGEEYQEDGIPHIEMLRTPQ